jgi:hypothetical protein
MSPEAFSPGLHHRGWGIGPDNPHAVALSWSIHAMEAAWLRLHDAGRANYPDRLSVFAALGEAVWWVTVVDKSLEATPNYKKLMAGLAENYALDHRLYTYRQFDDEPQLLAGCDPDGAQLG